MKENKSIETKLGALMLEFRRKIVEACRRQGVQQDITFSQAEILGFVGPSGTRTMREIAEHLKIAPPSVTAQVMEMEKRGFVKREVSKADRRVVSVSFTSKAKKAFEKISARKTKVLSSMLSKLSASDKKSLERIIGIIISK
jgi:DNA-binding MarR family transcriptional regulator